MVESWLAGMVTRAADDKLGEPKVLLTTISIDSGSVVATARRSVAAIAVDPADSETCNWSTVKSSVGALLSSSRNAVEVGRYAVADAVINTFSTFSIRRFSIVAMTTDAFA